MHAANVKSNTQKHTYAHALKSTHTNTHTGPSPKTSVACPAFKTATGLVMLFPALAANQTLQGLKVREEE